MTPLNLKPIEMTLKKIFELHSESATGTLFIATEDNSACQLVLQQGVPTQFAFSNLYAEEAVKQLLGLQQAKCSFQAELILPLPEEASISNPTGWLTELGFSEEMTTTDPAIEVQPTNTEHSLVDSTVAEDNNTEEDQYIYVERVYRGQTVREKRLKQGIAPASVSKAVRTYRGQVIAE